MAEGHDNLRACFSIYIIYSAGAESAAKAILPPPLEYKGQITKRFLPKIRATILCFIFFFIPKTGLIFAFPDSTFDCHPRLFPVYNISTNAPGRALVASRR